MCTQNCLHYLDQVKLKYYRMKTIMFTLFHYEKNEGLLPLPPLWFTKVIIILFS